MSGFWQEQPGLSPNRVRRYLRLIQLGLLNEFRNPALLRPALAAAAMSGVAVWLLRDTPGYAVLILSEWLGRIYGAAAGIWMTGYAARDLETGTRAGLLFRAKPADGGISVLLNWTVGLGVWLALLAAAFLAAALVLTATAGITAGMAMLASFGLSSLAVITLSALAFAATRTVHHPAAGGAVVVAWIGMAGPLAQMGLAPEYASNAVAWSFLALAGLTAVALLVERSWRDEPVRPGIAAALLVLLCLPMAARGATAFRGLGVPEASASTELVKLKPKQPIPNLELPASHGRAVSTGDLAGKISFVYLFSARDAYSSRSLNALRELHRELASSGIQPLAVAIDTQPGVGELVSRAADYGFPVGVDRGAFGRPSAMAAPTSQAFGAVALPMLVVSDRRRNIAEIRYDRHWSLPTLRAIARAQLTEEPR